ncbi:bifunctional diguanylate cyclase/phosphodiesterase [Vibrio sonorensis]|uniref:bifunctional diguanylate cyclase/phosphodiesterase n=1 Tax=Vibrio sonorensis TaxID=1004316 RepID=UPI0008DAF781|nr:EAL domain-containing protein [Vibrio sonorensis]
MSIRTPNKSLLAIWTTGISLAISAVISVGIYETNRLQEQVNHHFNNKVNSLDLASEDLYEVMKSTAAFIKNSNAPTVTQFESYLRNRTGIDTGVDSVLWLPAVSVADTANTEIRARKMGLLGYQVTPFPKQVPNSDAWYSDIIFPVLYASPKFEGSDYLGKRMETEFETRKAMEEAAFFNRLTVSTFNHEGMPGLRLILPVYKSERLLGFVIANLVIHEFLGHAWKQEVNSHSFDLTVYDEKHHNMLFASHLNQTLKTEHLFQHKASSEHLIEPQLLKQKWHVSLSVISNSSGFFIYGGLAFLLIMALTGSVSTAVRFYMIRLRVSDKVIEEKTQTLAIQAIKDSLTGLFNRQALSNEVELELKRIRENEIEGFSILFVDLDRFKMINDSMGHLLGDELLQQVAQRLVKNSRNEDICFRFGGDEFVVLLSEQTCQHQLARIAERYASLLSAPYQVQGQSCHIGASVGVSIVTDHDQDLASILREADTAMYHAKGSTHEKVVFFHERMFNNAKERFQLEQDLTVAIELRQIYLVYQPIYCIHSDSIVGFETLLRWNHPKRGHISPAEFIPIAEETGLIIKLGDWVLKETCKTLQRLWHSDKVDLIPRFNVNVSAKQFESQHVINTIEHLLKECDFPANRLGIELTESILLDEFAVCATNLQKLKDMGLVIYLDDFGTGYSSLAVLNDYPVDIVKMDRGFVSKIDDENITSNNLCEAVINMAHTINMSVVAEGVETEKQLALLEKFRCDYIQGFYKSKPVTGCKLLQTLNPPALHLVDSEERIA